MNVTFENVGRLCTHMETVEEETEVTEEVKFSKCGFKGCPNEPVGKAEFLPRHETWALCVGHLDMAYGNRQNWKVLK